MDRIKIQYQLDAVAVGTWESLIMMFPKLVRFDVPKIALNNRLTKTAGRCFQDTRTIEMGTKFFLKSANIRELYAVTLPHELIHQCDYDLFGESEFVHAHGKNWCMIMARYGLPAKRFHSMKV